MTVVCIVCLETLGRRGVLGDMGYVGVRVGNELGSGVREGGPPGWGRCSHVLGGGCLGVGHLIVSER